MSVCPAQSRSVATNVASIYTSSPIRRTNGIPPMPCSSPASNPFEARGSATPRGSLTLEKDLADLASTCRDPPARAYEISSWETATPLPINSFHLAPSSFLGGFSVFSKFSRLYLPSCDSFLPADRSSFSFAYSTVSTVPQPLTTHWDI